MPRLPRRFPAKERECTACFTPHERETKNHLCARQRRRPTLPNGLPWCPTIVPRNSGLRPPLGGVPISTGVSARRPSQLLFSPPSAHPRPLRPLRLLRLLRLLVFRSHQADEHGGE